MANQSSTNIKIGALVIAALAIVILGVSFLKGKKLFSNDQTYHSVFNSAEGLSKANKVVLNGVTIGKVEDIELVDNYQKVKITYVIDERVQVPADSKVKINSGVPGFGTPQLDLLVGSSPEVYASGSQIPVFQTESLTSKATKIIDELEPTSKSLKSTMESLDSVATNMNKLLAERNLKNIEASIANLNATMSSLNSTSKKVDQLVDAQTNKIDGIISDLQSISSNLKANQKYIDNSLANFSKTSDQLASLELKRTLDKTDETIAKLNSILNTVENGDGSLSLLLNDAELYNNLNNTARDLDRLILDIKEDPSEVVPTISIFGRKKK